MDKELQSKLVGILTSIQTATGKAADFAMEQLPDIAQSYVLYGRAYTLITILGLATVLTTLWVLAVRTARKKPNDESLFPMFMGLGGHQRARWPEGAGPAARHPYGVACPQGVAAARDRFHAQALSPSTLQ